MEPPCPRNIEHAPAQHRAFQLAEKAARAALRRRFRVVKLTNEAYKKLDRHESSIASVARDLRSMVRLATAWGRRDYREVPWKSVVYVVAAIIYFVNPVDLVPDVLTGIGFVDDAAVIAAVVRSVAADLAAFRAWEARRSEEGGGEAAVSELYPPASVAA
jgi:uncharacterized membrane protein YkvA (DUF1232 family)